MFIFRTANTGGVSSLFTSSNVVIPRSLKAISMVVMFIPFWTNPLVYVLSNRSYRLAYKALLCRHQAATAAAAVARNHHVYANRTLKNVQATHKLLTDTIL